MMGASTEAGNPTHALVQTVGAGHSTCGRLMPPCVGAELGYSGEIAGALLCWAEQV
jgi:hypothetical protein